MMEQPMSTDHSSPTYVEQNIAEYRDNPLIEALPPILTEKEAARAMILRPQIQPEERAMSTEERWHLLARLEVCRDPSFDFL